MDFPDHPTIAQLQNTISEMEEHKRAIKILRERLRIEVCALGEVEPGSARLALVQFAYWAMPLCPDCRDLLGSAGRIMGR